MFLSRGGRNAKDKLHAGTRMSATDLPLATQPWSLVESYAIKRMTSSPELTDEELLESYRREPNRAEREKCAGELFRRYHRPVGLWCLRLTGERETAADLAQEIFVKAYRSLGRFKREAKFSTWLYSITRNHCLNYIQSRKRRPRALGEDQLTDLRDERSERVFESIDNEDHLKRFRKAMNEVLTDVERKAMVLRYVEELPMATVTRMLRLENRSGAKAYIVSAKRKLRRVLPRIQAQQGHGWA